MLSAFPRRKLDIEVFRGNMKDFSKCMKGADTDVNESPEKARLRKYQFLGDEDRLAMNCGDVVNGI